METLEGMQELAIGPSGSGESAALAGLSWHLQRVTRSIL